MSKLVTSQQLKAAAQKGKTFDGKVAQAAADAIEEVMNSKANKSVTGSAVLPVGNSWKNTVQSGPGIPDGYSLCWDQPVSNVTENDRVIAVVEPGSIAAAAECGLCPTNYTLAGAIRFWAKTMPGSNIRVNYWIEKE